MGLYSFYCTSQYIISFDHRNPVSYSSTVEMKTLKLKKFKPFAQGFTKLELEVRPLIPRVVLFPTVRLMEFSLSSSKKI